MHRLITIQNPDSPRSLCADRGGLVFAATGMFRVTRVSCGRHSSPFSPVRIILQYATESASLAALRHKSKTLHRNQSAVARRRHEPPSTARLRRRSPDWQRQFHWLESVGLNEPGNPGCPARNRSEKIQIPI